MSLDSFGAHSFFTCGEVRAEVENYYFASNKSNTFRYIDRPRKVYGRWAMDTIRLGPVRRDAEFGMARTFTLTPACDAMRPSLPGWLGFGFPSNRDGNTSSF